MTHPWSRRAVLAVAAGAATAALPLRANPAFPSKPITLWVPWPAGGATDLTLRQLAELAGKSLGQKVLIENRAGAGGTLAMPVIQQAAPDGYTLAQLPQTALRFPWTQKVSWDPIRDTTPILQLSGVTFGIVVPAASAVRSMDDLFALMKAKPGAVTVSTNGVGTTPHLVMDQLTAARGLKYVHVPFKGTAEQMLAVASGQVMVGVNSNGFAPFVQGGRLRLIATMGPHRTTHWPDVPTLKELGLGIVATSPYGLVAPHGLPAPILQTLHDAFKAALLDPVHVAELAKYEQEPMYLGSADYAEALKTAYAEEGAAMKRLGLLKPA